MTNNAAPYSLEDILLAKKIGKQPAQLPQPILNLLKETTPRALEKHPCAKLLRHHRITLKEASEWFVAFAKGAQYVHETYGSCFNDWILCGCVSECGMAPNDNYIGYLQESDRILVTAKRIAWDMRHARDPEARFGISRNREPHYSMIEKITLLGVEEAYHAHQTKHLWHKYEGRHLPPPPPSASHEDIAAYYANDPVERDAHDVAEQAAQQLGLGNNRSHRILMA